MHRVRVGIVLQCMQAMPQQIYLHDGVPTSFEPGIVVQPSGVVHHSCASLPVVDVHPYFTECLDAHQIVVSCLLLASDAAVMGLFVVASICGYLWFAQLLCSPAPAVCPKQVVWIGMWQWLKIPIW